MSETEAPTPVGPPVRGLRAQVAHGPEKDWSRVGQTVPVQVTLPAEMLQWLRANDYVPSRVLREAVGRLMGSGELDRLERQIEYHREQVTILEAARATIGAKRAQAESAEAAEKAKQAEIQRLSAAFWAGRDDNIDRFSRASNLRWIEGRIARIPELRNESPQHLLDLFMSVRRREGAMAE